MRARDRLRATVLTASLTRLLITFVAALPAYGLAGCPASSDEPAEPPASAPKAVASAEGPNFQAAITISPRLVDETVVVAVDLLPGYHVYTTGETTGRPIAIELEEGGRWSAAGPAVYPEGEKKTTALGTSVVVEGHAEARLPVTAEGEDPPGPVKGRFRYQVCTDEACDRPRTMPFSLEPS